MSNNPTHDFRVLLGTQLVDHLKSLRKLRGLTQAELGQLLGLSQARVAMMEARPGSLTLDQLLRLLNALGADMLIRARPPRAETARQPPDPARRTERVTRSSSTRAPSSRRTAPDKLTSFTLKLPKNKGSW
jgi:HTH-type transcriptional regulator/antitoxin HipB